MRQTTRGLQTRSKRPKTISRWGFATASGPESQGRENTECYFSNRDRPFRRYFLLSSATQRTPYPQVRTAIFNDKIVIPEAMRTPVIAMLHQRHVAVTKIDKAAKAFWWTGLHRDLREKSETCPSCRAAEKNHKTQIPQTEINRLEFLTELRQENQLDFAGPIKSQNKRRCIFLVAIDRFRNGLTAQLCKNTDTRTVLNCLTKYFSDNGTPRTIRTDNGSCFKSKEF